VANAFPDHAARRGALELDDRGCDRPRYRTAILWTNASANSTPGAADRTPGASYSTPGATHDQRFQ
jgi:hypothetical protein